MKKRLKIFLPIFQTEAMGSAVQWIENALPYWALFYAASLFLLIFILLLRWPIVAGDFDLWFHLSAGRFVWQNHAIPGDAFFSFISPRPVVDYSWLFEAGLYPLYVKFGYPGIVILRACCFAAIAGMTGVFLWDSPSLFKRPSAYCCVVFAFYAAFIIPRLTLVRPHLYSYFCIISFLYILEYRAEWAVLLPVLAALWANIHGIYYSVMIPVLMVYALEYYFQRLRNGVMPAREQKTLAFLGLSMAAFFLTPFGPHLLDLPVGSSIEYVSRHVAELMPVSWNDISTLDITAWMPNHETIFNFILYAAGLSLIAGLVRKRLKVRYFLLFAWGAFLISRCFRFKYECAFFFLPLLKAEPFFDSAILKRLMPKPVLIVVLIAILALPVSFVKAFFTSRPRYPLSPQKIPHGIVAFLNRVDTGGRLLNTPDEGGYLEWALYPRYQIGMTMQLPAPFNDSDFYLMYFDFLDHKLLQKVVSNYHPDFLAVPRVIGQFPDAVAPYFPDYVPVFFDDEDALYVSRSRHPDLARFYALPVNPFNLPKTKDEKAQRESSGCGLPVYLARIIAIDPNIVTARWHAADFCSAHNDFSQELSHAQAIIDNVPDTYLGYWLKGRALQEMGKPQEALKSLHLGLQRADSSQSMTIYVEMAKIYLALKQVDKAKFYEMKADNAFPPDSWLEAEAEKQERTPKKVNQ